MQIIKYEINKTILTVGFRENSFVVYVQIPFVNTISKQNLLQYAYEQCKSAIDYEKTQTYHPITTSFTGEEFIPAIAKVDKVVIDNFPTIISCSGAGNITQQFTAKAYTQYGDLTNHPIAFSLDSYPSLVTMVDGLLTIGEISDDCDLILTATCEGVSTSKPIHIKKYAKPLPTAIELLTAELATTKADLEATTSAVDFLIMNLM